MEMRTGVELIRYSDHTFRKDFQDEHSSTLDRVLKYRASLAL